MTTAQSIALSRFGLGARPGDPRLDDPRRWLGAQLDRFDPRPAPIAAVPTRAAVVGELADYLAQQRAGRRERRMSGAQAAAQPDPARDAEAEARRFARRGVRGNYFRMAAARIEAALTTPAPFAERLVHFWANHFAVSADKLPVVGLAGLLEFEAIRPNLLGRFADMLLAVERHPAMLLYLDQAQSIGPGSQAAAFAGRRGGQARGLNENLAREILELHTLGVDGGYRQADVTELARALTGWTVGGLARGPLARMLGNAAPGSFQFVPQLHEPGRRTVLGRSHAPGGEEQGRAILADLAARPATARHLATKLARHFAGDVPPREMVDRLASAYLDSGGDLPTLYRAIIASPEAWAPRPVKFKSPWDWSVSALRALGRSALDERSGAMLLDQLGQPIWRPGSPAGWDDVAASWAGPEALVRRVEVAERLAERAPGEADARAIAEAVLPGTLGPATRAAIARAESPRQGLALLLVAPEFLRR